RTMWERVRPYVYMAAMFAGVWCMLNLFTTGAGANELAPIEKNPGMAEALSNDDFMNTYVVDDLSDRDIMDQMLEDGFDPSMFDPDPEQETE
ncbi:MAG: hypothetical protein K2L99_08775, partial [Muribaculaceae bacterium]|nr:hypothetical protein [Muribaculaceae bacterium]